MSNVRRTAKRIKVSLPNLPIALIQRLQFIASLLVSACWLINLKNKSNFASAYETNENSFGFRFVNVDSNIVEKPNVAKINSLNPLK